MGRAAIVCLGPPDPLALARAAAAAAAYTARRFEGPRDEALSAGVEWLAAPESPPSRLLLYLLAGPGDVAFEAERPAQGCPLLPDEGGVPREARAGDSLGPPSPRPGPRSWSGYAAPDDAPAVAELARPPGRSARHPGRADLPRALARLFAGAPPGPGLVLTVVVELRRPPGDLLTGREAYRAMVDAWRACGPAAGSGAPELGAPPRY